MAKVVVAWTTPFVAKRVPLKEPRPRVVVVALVKSALVAMSEEEKREVEVALVAWKVAEKKLVEVACEVVALRAEKSWKVEEAVTARLPKKPVPETEIAVDDAYGKVEAVVEVAVNDEAVPTPLMTSAPRMSASPAASRMLPVVVVALVPRRRI
jgi:hypothetical protein